MEKTLNSFNKNKQELSFETYVLLLRNINFFSSYDSSASLINFKDRIEYPQINLDKFTNNIEVDIEDNLTNRQHTEMASESRKVYGTEIDYPLLYELYRDVNKEKKELYIFEEFHNVFKILNYVLINFREALQINLNEILEEKIIFYFTNFTNFINFPNSQHQSQGETCQEDSPSIILNIINSKITKDNIKIQNLTQDEISLIKSLLFIFYIFTMCGKLILHTPLSLKDYFHNVNLYCRMFISHFKYFLLIHIMMIIFYQLAYREEMNFINSQNIFKNESKETSQIKINSRELDKDKDKANVPHPTLFCIDVENLLDKKIPLDEFDKLILITSFTKIFLFNYFTVGLNLNLNFLNLEYFRSTIFFYEFNPQLFGFVDLCVDHTVDYFFNSHNLNFLNYNNFLIEKIFINLNFDKKFLDESREDYTYTNQHLDNTKNFFVLKKFEEIFKKSSAIFITDNIPRGSTYVTINSFLNQFEIVYDLIDFLSKIFKTKEKKKQKFSFFITLNFFTIYVPDGNYNEKLPAYRKLNSDSIFSFIKSKSRKNLQFNTNFSNIREREFLVFLSKTQNFLSLHRKFFEQIKYLKLKFKKMLNINITFLEENFESEELNTLINLFSLSLHNYLEEKKFKHVQIKEISNVISPKHTLYLSDIYKEKEKKNILDKFLNKMQNPSVTFLLKFSDQLINYFIDIVITDMLDNTYPFKANILYRNFQNNKVIFICREDNCYLIDIYLHDLGSYQSIIDFVKILKSDRTFGVLIKKIHMIFYDTMFRQVLCDANIQTECKTMFSLVDNIYVISSTRDHLVEYDIYILESKLCILITAPCLAKKSKKLDEDAGQLSIKKMIYILFKILFDDQSVSDRGNDDHPCDNKTIVPSLAGIDGMDSNSIPNKINLFSALLNSKERYFSRIQFIYRLYPDSSLRLLDLSDNYLSIRKICSKSTSIKSLSSLFNSVDKLKLKQTLPIFFCYSEAKSENKRNLLRSIIDLKLDYTINISKLDDVFNPVTNTEEVSALLNSFLIVFLRYLHEKIFDSNYDQLRLILFNQKIFFNFLNLFSNFYSLNECSLFKNVSLIPLYSNVKLNSYKKNIFEIFLEEFRKFYFINTFYYTITRNICVINLDWENISKEYRQEMKDMTNLFRRSNTEDVVRQIQSECEKISIGNSVFRYQSLQSHSLLYVTYSNENLKILRNEKIFRKLVCFLKIEVSVNCYVAKNGLIEKLIVENKKRKNQGEKEIIFGDDRERNTIDERKSIEVEKSNRSKNEGTKKIHNSKNKKCLIY